MSHLHKESHLVERIRWLRAAVLGAIDGIISTASLILVRRCRSREQTSCSPVSLALFWRNVYGGRRIRFGQLSIRYRQADITSERAGACGRSRLRKRGAGADLCRAWRGVGLARQSRDNLSPMIRSARTLGRARNLGDPSGEARPGLHHFSDDFSARGSSPARACPTSRRRPLIPIVSAGSLFLLAVLAFLGARTGGAAMLKPMMRVTFGVRSQWL